MRTTVGLLFVCSAVLCSPALAPGQETRAFNDWWERIVSGGSSGPAIDNISIVYSVESDRDALASRLASLRAQRPSEATLGEMHALQQQLSAQNPPMEFRLWKKGSEWRLCRENPPNSSVGPYTDMAWADGIAWQMTPVSLVVVDQVGIARTPYRIDSAGSSISHDCEILLTGGVGGALGNGIELSARQSGERWTTTASAVRSDGARVSFEASGIWREAEKWGEVHRSQLTVVYADGSQGHVSIETRDWKPLPGREMGIAGWAKVQERRSRLVRIFRVEEIGTFTDSEFAKAVRRPSPTRPDPIRGPTTFTSITDVSSGGKELLEVSQDRRRVTPRFDDPETKRTRVTKTLGWVAGSGLGAMLVFIWLRRRIH
jgi:hypothetical protein